MNTVEHLPEQQVFVLLNHSQEIGRLKYEVSDGQWNISHTVVDPAFQGRGLARVLVDAAVAEAEKHRIRLTASCEYAEHILNRR